MTSINEGEAGVSEWRSCLQAEISSHHELHSPLVRNNETPFIPIIYNNEYDIHFFKLENCHPFDTQKWGKIAGYLKQFFKTKGIEMEFLSPRRPIGRQELRVVHSDEFIDNIERSHLTVVMATEVALLCFVPMCLIRKRLITPLKWQTAGSVLAGYVALKCGWCIHLGGGFHHCCAQKAEGFCLFADITLLMKFLWQEVDDDLKFMVVDLDAHQGNGYAKDVLQMRPHHQNSVYIMDMFNSSIFPGDEAAKEAINRMIMLRSYTGDRKYLNLLEHHLKASLAEFNPSLIIYNAGTDVLHGDQLGCLSVTAEGIIKRDEILFTQAKQRNIPVLMLTSGGYQRNNAAIISRSVANLFEKEVLVYSHLQGMLQSSDQHH